MGTYKIIGRRWLRKYTEPETSPVYAANVQAQKIVRDFCDVPWQSVIAKQAAMTYHTSEVVDKESGVTGLEMNVSIRDGFDAALFCAGHVGGMHRAYANAACYVYAIPDDAVGSVVTSLSLNVTSDPYNSQGARLHVMTGSTLEIPTNCHTVRGEDSSGVVVEDGTTAAGFAPRTVTPSDGKDYWYPTMATATLSPTGGMTLQKYLFIFVCLESYSTVRGNWLEGSSYIDNLVEITTSGSVTGWTDGETYDLSEGAAATVSYTVCRDGVLPYLASAYTGVKHATVQLHGDELTPTTSGSNRLGLVHGLKPTWADVDGEIYSVCVPPPTKSYVRGTNEYRGIQIGTVVGNFADGSIDGIPGLLLYDMDAAGGPAKLSISIELEAVWKDALAQVRAGKLRGCYPYVARNTASSSTDGSGVVTKTQLFCVALYLTFSDRSALMADRADDGTAAELVVPPILLKLTSVQTGNSDPVVTPADDDSIFRWVRDHFDGCVWDASAVCDYFTVTSYHTALDGYNQLLALGVEDGKIVSKPFKLTGTTVIQGDRFAEGVFPAAGVAISGTVNAICPAPTMDRESTTHSILVSGDLTSVGGVACSGAAIITAGATASDAATVTVPDYLANLQPVPGTGFQVVSIVPQPTPEVGEYGASEAHLRISDVLICGRFAGAGGDPDTPKVVDVHVSDGESYEIADVSSFGTVLGAMTTDSRGLLADRPLTHYANISRDITGEQSYMGLRTLYAKLFKGDLQCADQAATGSAARVGAGFCVRRVAQPVLALEHQGMVSSQLLQMTIASLVVPFAVPQDCRATRIKLDWSALASTGGRLNVWLYRKMYITEVPDISDPAIYTGEKKDVNSWVLLGQIDPADTSATFDIAPLEGYVATLMFTAYLSPDSLAPINSISAQGVCTAMAVDPISGEVTGTSANWKPDITLQA